MKDVSTDGAIKRVLGGGFELLQTESRRHLTFIIDIFIHLTDVIRQITPLTLVRLHNIASTWRHDRKYLIVLLKRVKTG